MLENDAQRVAAAIVERVDAAGPQVSATVQRQERRSTVTAHGAGRPTFITYRIEVRDATRVAVLPFEEATALLADVQQGWDPDRLFTAIRDRGVPVAESGGA